MTARSLTRQALQLDEAGLLRIDGQPWPLPPKERAALRLLLEAPGVVKKDDFAQRVWAGGDMSDEALARCISRLRRVLGPCGLKIDAVYGMGYQLLEAAAAPAATSSPSAAALESFAHARQLLLQRTPAAMGLAIELLRALVQGEPGFAAARVALADALATAVGWGLVPTPGAVDEGLAALLTLDRADGMAPVPGMLAARGALLDMAWRFAEAEQCFDRAMASEGKSDSPETLLALARHRLYTDQPAQAVALLQRVRQLSPHALHVRMALTRALVQGGRGGDALAEAQATVADHPGQLVTMAFALAIEAMVAPHAELEAAAWRLTQGLDAPPFAWTVAAYVFSRLKLRGPTLDIVDTSLLCARMSAGEASLYAAPLAALGEFDRAAALLRAAVDERCGMMAMVLRDPAHAHWLPQHPAGRELMRTVFGPQAAMFTR